MIETGTGGNRNISYEQAALTLAVLGRGRYFIPLNGGSDTRRSAREWHQQRFACARIPFHSNGSMVCAGGFTPPHTRGWRYVVSDFRGQWLHWRKAKRA